MSDVLELLQRQAEWQKARAQLSWSEKLMLAEMLRDAAVAMRPQSPRERRTQKPPDRDPAS